MTVAQVCDQGVDVCGNTFSQIDLHMQCILLPFYVKLWALATIQFVIKGINKDAHSKIT